jgi:hypothetical protein
MRFIALASAMLLSLAASAQAQIIPLPPGTGGMLRILPTDGTAFAQTSGARGSLVTASDRPIAAVSALSMFSLGFENGDHKFRRLQVLPEGVGARFAFNDSGDDDPFSAQARWVNVVGGSAANVSGNGGGRVITELTIPAGPANHTFALRGFELRRADGTDANVRTLAINLAPSRTAIRVQLVDDERADLRLQVLRNPGRSGPDIGRRYNVTIHYAWIPNSAVLSQGSITGSERGRDAAAVPATGLPVIRGFNFTFNNSDHHLLGVGINLADGGSVTFQDNNLDDPMRWQVDYAVLRTS